MCNTELTEIENKFNMCFDLTSKSYYGVDSMERDAWLYSKEEVFELYNILEDDDSNRELIAKAEVVFVDIDAPYYMDMCDEIGIDMYSLLDIDTICRSSKVSREYMESEVDCLIYIRTFEVQKEHRNKGIGSAFLNLLLSILQNQKPFGITTLISGSLDKETESKKKELLIKKSNKFYKRNGMHKIGTLDDLNCYAYFNAYINGCK